jgi:hypothetical protein
MISFDGLMVCPVVANASTTTWRSSVTYTEEGAGEEEREEGGEEAGEERGEEASEGELQLLVGEVCCCTFSSN